MILDQAICLDPNLALAYCNKGAVLNGLKRYEEAIVVLDQAIHLDPNLALAYSNKGTALERLGRYKEAQQARRQAKKLH